MNAPKILCSTLMFGLLCVSGAASAGPSAKGLLAGKVDGPNTPVSSAGVYAYQLADLTLTKVVTDSDGNFLFKHLPAGLYKLIAHKSGFVPAVITLARSSAEADQFVNLELVSDSLSETAAPTDFWAVRKKIPRDVLRDIGLVGEPQLAQQKRQKSSTSLERMSFLDSNLNAEMQALAGIHQGAHRSSSPMSGGRLGLDGNVGRTKIDFDGYYLKMDGLDSSSGLLTAASGRQSSMSLRLKGEGSSQVNLASRSSRMVMPQSSGESPMNFDQFQVSWKAPMGSRGESEFSANFTEESNFYSSGAVEPSAIPDASRTLNLQGSYSRSIGNQGNFQTQLRYRERESSFSGRDSVSLHGPLGLNNLQAEEESVELVSRGGWRLQPAVLLEYGLATKLRDGSLSFVPHAGVVFQLNDFWQATTQISHRIDQEEDPLRQEFIPSFFHESGHCETTGESCYRIALSRHSEDDSRFTIGAMHREFGETLRFYFNEDFFNHLESLFLVRGDRLPELQLSFSRRLSPTILTTVSSNVASGGGGTVFTVNDEPYENRLRYLVTSLDTQFLGTSTGLLFAFHHLQQELEPLLSEGIGSPLLELDRLQVRVTQDLNFLARVAADWALQLNVELSRGSSELSALESSDDEELRQRFLGGIAVRF
ncbi:MAG: carboxypeptidase-like regulatory domain-containing protein [Deltaproteobacteria bacterium]|nr:carboxypeptidase-like regulatory domain-containing protein [Deltaproteobacteria bacterium]